MPITDRTATLHIIPRSASALLPDSFTVRSFHLRDVLVLIPPPALVHCRAPLRATDLSGLLLRAPTIIQVGQQRRAALFTMLTARLPWFADSYLYPLPTLFTARGSVGVRCGSRATLCSSLILPTCSHGSHA